MWFFSKNILEKLEWKTNKTTVYRNIEKLLEQEKIIEDFSKTWEKIYSKKEKVIIIILFVIFAKNRKYLMFYKFRNKKFRRQILI
jgi:hypothetical protein